MTIVCSSCGRSYRVANTFAGAKVKCRNCGTIFTVEAAAPLPPPSNDPFEQVSNDPTVVEETTAPSWEKLQTIEIDGSISGSAKPLTAEMLRSQRLTGRAGRGGPNWVRLAMLLLFFEVISTLVFGIYVTTSALSRENHSAELLAHLWTWDLIGEVLFFIALAPAVWLGVWAASKILNFAMVDSPYLRACGVIAGPMILLYIALISPAAVAYSLAFLLILLLAAGVMLFYDLDWEGAAVAAMMALGALFFVGFLGETLLSATLSGGITTIVAQAMPADSNAGSLLAQGGSGANATDASGNSPGATPGASSGAALTPGAAETPTPADDSEMVRLKQSLAEKEGLNLSLSTREEFTDAVAEMRRQAKSIRKANPMSAEAVDLVRRVEEFAKKVDELPSGMVDQSIFTNPTDVDDWTTGDLSRGRLNGEVSYLQYKIQPPLEAKFDLHSSPQGPPGLTWTTVAPAGLTFSISSQPRKDIRQLRPLLSDKPVALHNAEAAGLLAINTTGLTVEYGQINGLNFTRLSTGVGSGDRWTEYLSPIDDGWLVIRFTLPPTSDPVVKILDAAARTVRKAEPGEKPSDPFGARFIASHLADDFDEVAPMIRKQGSAAEAGLAMQLTSADPVLRRRALELLMEVGTSKSLAAVQKLTNDPDPAVAGLARDVARHLSADNATAPPPANP